MIRILAFVSLLLLTPLAAAAPPPSVNECAGPACVILNPDDRFSYYGANVYDENTGAFAAAGYGEGSGFFGDTATFDVFAYEPTTGQWAVFVIALNDYDRDGDYEDAGFYTGTWNDDPAVPSVGHGHSTTLP